MDSVKFEKVKAEKANAIPRHQRVKRITTLFRIVELLIFLITIISTFSTHFTFSFTQYLRGISATLISPRFVFLLGNAIVILLFFISGPFSPQKGEKGTDFYDEYVKKCRINQQQTVTCSNKYKDNCSSTVVPRDEKKIMMRSQSETNLERRRSSSADLRRSMSQQCRKSVGCGRRAAAGGGFPDEMSSEEFRQTVEAFIARQQRFLREEEEFSAVVPYQS